MLSEVLPAQLDFQRRGEAEELRTAEVDLRARMRLHRRAQALGLARFDFLAAAVGHHDGELADVLAALGRVGVQARAAAADAVQRADAVVLGVLALQLAHQRVGVAQRRAGRQLHRHLEAILRQLRDQVGAEHRHRQQRQRERRAPRSPAPATACAARWAAASGSRVRRGRTAPSRCRWPCASPGRPPRPARARRARSAQAMPKNDAARRRRRCRARRPRPASAASTSAASADAALLPGTPSAAGP